MTERFISFRWAVIVCALLMQGCGVSFSVAPANVPKERPIGLEGEAAPDHLPSYVERRPIVAPGVDLGTTVLVLHLDPAAWEWGFADDTKHPKGVTEWRKELGASIAINGSYFNENGMPSGFYQLHGDWASKRPWPGPQEIANRSGYSGMIIVDHDELHLAYLPIDKPLFPIKFDSVFLSYPTLVVNGHAMVEKESGLRARRTVLAEDASGTDYILVTETGIVSLFDLSTWLAVQPEHFTRAVNLDGGPSTGLSLADGDATIDLGFAAVPNVVYLKAKTH